MGRHGEAFRTFGDYSVNLFAHIEFDRTPPSRALYDVGAAAILKNPAWATRGQRAPALVGKHWEDRANNPRKIVIGRTSTATPSSPISSGPWIPCRREAVKTQQGVAVGLCPTGGDGLRPGPDRVRRYSSR